MAVESLNFAADQISFAGKMGILLKSTSDDDSPIPGYLYKEISDISFQSPAHCEFLLDFLVKRLNKSSCHVKYKTLKLMKHLVGEADPAFTSGLRHNSHSLQEATKFGGPPDPVHGNLPYQVVRKIAKELCQVVFDVDQTSGVQSAQSRTSMSALRTVGIGPSQTSTGGKYQGFGNTPAVKKSLGNSIRDGLEKLAEQLGDPGAQRQAALLSQLEDTGGDYVPPVVSPASLPCLPQSRADSQRSRPEHKAAVPKHVPGRAGGGWDEDPDPAQEDTSGTQSQGSSGQSERLEAVSVADWSAEEQLVRDHLRLDEGSQLPPLLRPSHLQAFKKSCQGLNCERVVEVINLSMASTDGVTLLRAMLLLETFLLRSDTVSLDFIVSVCQQQLNNLTQNHADQRVKDKALKIIRGLERYSSSPNILEAFID